MIVSIERVEYIVPDAMIAGCKRTFRGSKARRDGLHIDQVRSYLGSRLAPRVFGATKIEYADLRSNEAGVIPVAWGRATTIADRLGERLVRQWVREGYLVRCGFGRYKLNAKRGKR